MYFITVVYFVIPKDPLIRPWGFRFKYSTGLSTVLGLSCYHLSIIVFNRIVSIKNHFKSGQMLMLWNLLAVFFVEAYVL